MSIIVDGITLNTYLDVMKLTTNKAKEQGFRAMAEHKYNAQPSFMKRGTDRWNFLIAYDPIADKILWDEHPIPGSMRLKTNCQPNERLGKVVLVLMVKNESPIIERALRSCITQIDGFIILDTGSTDDTVEKMWALLHTEYHKKGEIYQAPFYDFSSNRSIVSQLAFQRGEWLLLYDADYTLVLPEPLKQKFNMREQREWVNKLPSKSSGVRSLLVNTSGQLQYSRPHIVDGDCRWSYYCRTHEFLGRSKHCSLPEPSPQQQFDYIQIDHIGDGNCKSDKVQRDIVLLLMDLYDSPKSERAFFYLGNSLMGAGMYEWAIRCYSKAMNYCGWFEEMYISAKEMVNCFRFLDQPWERRIGMLLHGMFQNPNRLEMLTHFIRDLRHQDDKAIREEYTHLVCSIAACFTHNQFPADQKLFIDRYDHELAFWTELALLCQDIPIYVPLGCYAAKKAKDSKYFNEIDLSMRQRIRDEVHSIHEAYQHRLREWDRTRVFKSPAIADYLLEQAHAHFAKRNFAVAKQLYEELLMPCVSTSLLPQHLRSSSSSSSSTEVQKPQKEKEEGKEEEKKPFRMTVLNQLETSQHHLWSPLTSWIAGQSVFLPAQQNKMLKSDETSAVVCHQLALCQQQLKPNQKFAAVAYLIDALKFIPTFCPATSKLYELTHMANSNFTRAILYSIRLATFGRMNVQSKHTYNVVQEQIHKASASSLDLSSYCSVALGNGCLEIRPKTITKRCFPVARFGTLSF